MNQHKCKSDPLSQNYTFETPSGETAILLEFDLVGRDEVDSLARIPVLVAHERRGTVLMGRDHLSELLVYFP